MIIVTGGAGFIGSCLVKFLNDAGFEDLIVVDHFADDLGFDATRDPKKHNLQDKKFTQYFDKQEFITQIRNRKFTTENIDCFFHMGACSSTTLTDEKYYQENNLQYSIDVGKWSLENNIRFIYASSAATYGDGSDGYADDLETIQKCKPLNFYGWSKQNFDLWVVENNLLDQVVGLKFFNVFGPNEYHKGNMRSVILKSFDGVVNDGLMKLFKSYHPEFADGDQKRDFIYVKDVCDVMLFFMHNTRINGIFNLGTGQARTWNDVARSLFKAVDQPENIEYIEMPDILQNKYQYFTEATMDKLRTAGYKKPFTSLENAVKDYASYLKEKTFF